jgi:hypothetical protein
VDDPTALLRAPGEPDDSLTNGFVNPLDFFNYASPSAWINEAIANLTGVDVYGWMCDWIGGNWEAVWRFGDAVGYLGDCFQQIGIKIQQAVIDADKSWDGNAGDSAYQYFSTLAAAVSGQQLALHDAAESYHKAARGAWELSSQLGNILQALSDKVIIAGIAAALGTATAETGVGAVVGYGVSGLMVVQMLELVNRASTIINTAGTVILGLFGGAMALAHQGGDLSSVPLPTVAYSAPGGPP